jgi:hypothetical protein
LWDVLVGMGGITSLLLLLLLMSICKK